ncbi:hypothetical protein PoB_006930300 [Plakobranchus ocellatus]|uniref:Uncharacterized protein n=1 Tax=Plakobranchus ocellatus TaxID=259542 RepID=A0AAV4DET9_9GAST|nr:hypothetical protein PoB_006930300 [Plakobranchus ocellatus]
MMKLDTFAMKGDFLSLFVWRGLKSHKVTLGTKRFCPVVGEFDKGRESGIRRGRVRGAGSGELTGMMALLAVLALRRLVWQPFLEPLAFGHFEKGRGRVKGKK